MQGEEQLERKIRKLQNHLGNPYIFLYKEYRAEPRGGNYQIYNSKYIPRTEWVLRLHSVLSIMNKKVSTPSNVNVKFQNSKPGIKGES